MNCHNRLQNSGHDLVFDNFLLAFLQDTHVGDGCDDISEYLFLFIWIKKLKEDFKKAFLGQLWDDIWVFCQVTD